MPNRRITAVKRPRIRFHKWQCITARLKACKILNYTYRYVKAVPFGNKRCTKGVPSCPIFFFFFLVQAVGPWYGASATKPFWVPSPGSVQAYNEFKNIRDVLWVEILLIILLIYAICSLCHLKAFLLNWTVIVYRRRRWILVQRLGVLKTCIL